MIKNKKSILSVLVVSMLLFSACGSVEAIGDREVQFNDAEQRFEVLWVFFDQDDNEMESDADIKIVIVNDNEEEVYNKVTHVTEKDFSYWSSGNGDSEKLMGCVYIPIKDIKPGSVDDGVLTLYVQGDGFSFEKSNYTVHDLPLRQAQIRVPDVPLRVNDYDLMGELDTTLEITEINTEVEDGHLTLKFKCTMVYNSDGDKAAKTSHFKYRLLDESGVIEDTGTVYTESIRVGDTSYEEEILLDVDLSKDYTLELFDNER